MNILDISTKEKPLYSPFSVIKRANFHVSIIISTEVCLFGYVIYSAAGYTDSSAGQLHDKYHAQIS